MNKANVGRATLETEWRRRLSPCKGPGAARALARWRGSEEARVERGVDRESGTCTGAAQALRGEDGDSARGLWGLGEAVAPVHQMRE
jgi:hypothetical protein